MPSSRHSSSHNAIPSRSAPPTDLHRVPVLVGPTASGKTAVSITIARELGAEIISADSRQLFTLMDIGTAKPSLGERSAVVHHFIDELRPDADFNAGEFGKRGREMILEIFGRGKIPFVVGGSGLYIRSLVDGFFEGPGSDSEIRASLTSRLAEVGGAGLLEELRKVDPASAAGMLPSNTRRIVRALEVYRLTGTPISELQKADVFIPFSPVMAGLRWERKELYDRINRRADTMVRDGLVDEVRRLRLEGYDSNLNALQTVGYKEAFEFLDGRIDHERMVDLIRQNTRRYAKRQMTWFRKDDRIQWFGCGEGRDLEETAQEVTAWFRDEMNRGRKGE
jgi:tRNA dimethylallyltransferase